MKGDRGILDAEKTLKSDQSQDIGKAILPKDGDDFAIARQMRSELHRAPYLVEDHA